MRLRDLIRWSALMAIGLSSMARASLQIPVEPAQPRELTVVKGSYLVSAAVMDVRGQPHVFYGGLPSSGIPFSHAWFDGLVWRAIPLSNDIVDTVEAMWIGNLVHLAVTVRTSGASTPALEYWRVDPLTHNILRRPITSAAVSDVQLLQSPDGSEARLVYRQQNGSAVFLTGLSGTPNLQPLNLPPDTTRVFDAIGVPGLGTVIAFLRAPSGALPSLWARLELSNGNSSEELIANTSPLAFGGIDAARLALENDDSVIVGYTSRPGLYAKVRRSGVWSCPPVLFPSDCYVWGGNSDQLVVAGDAGSGDSLVGLLDQHGTNNVLRVFRFSNVEEYTAATPGDQIEIIRDALHDVQKFQLDLSLRMRTAQSAWQQYPVSALPAATRALTLSVDRWREPVIVTDSGSELGLRRTRWDPLNLRFASLALRPGSERYRALASVHTSDGTLEVAAFREGVDQVQLLSLPVGASQASVTPLSAAGIAADHVQIVRRNDDSLLVLWQEGATTMLAERAANGAVSVAPVPGSWDATSLPRLALTPPGLVLVSGYDSASGGIRVQRLNGGQWSVVSEVAGPLLPLHALAGSIDAEPALLYAQAQTEASPPRLYYRYLNRGEPVDLELPIAIPFNAAPSALSLMLNRGSAADAHVLAAVRDSANPGSDVYYARRTASSPAAPFELHTLGALSAAELSAGMGLVLSTDIYIAAKGAQVDLLRHRYASALDAPAPAPDVVATGTVNLDDGRTEEGFWQGTGDCVCAFLCTDGGAAQRGATQPGLVAQLALRMAQSPAGQWYLDLFRTHALDLAQVLSADAQAMADGENVFALYTPALRAFVDGRGGTVELTAEMNEQAAAMWRRWAAAGSPALRSAIEAELTRTDGLHVYDGMTVDQWFTALPGAPALFRDGYEGP